MTTVRVLSHPDASHAPIVVFGRSYSAAPGTLLDVPDGDAAVLGANGWTIIAPSGPTSARPPRSGLTGNKFFDTTLNQLLIFDGAAWRDQVTGIAV